MSAQSRAAWALAERQDDLVRRDQLLALGYTRHAIGHRVARGRLHRIWPEVYAVGRPTVTRRGLWRGAVWACGEGAALSHDSGANLWRIRHEADLTIHVSVPHPRSPRLEGITVHRRTNLRPFELVEREGIAVTRPATTVVDLAPSLPSAELERVINRADKLELIDPEALRTELDRMPRRPGKARVRKALDRHTFVLTDSELERRFVPIALRAGLGMPLTGVVLSGFKVDFFWPDLGLVVETDGLRYHRTPAQQTRDRLRDQGHTAAGLTPLRFTHAQVRYEAGGVEAVLRRVRRRLVERSTR